MKITFESTETEDLIFEESLFSFHLVIQRRDVIFFFLKKKDFKGEASAYFSYDPYFNKK